MSEPAGVVHDSAPFSARPHFSFLVTVICSIVVATYIGLPVGPLLRDASPLGQLDHPEESLERLVTRELDSRQPKPSPLSDMASPRYVRAAAFSSVAPLTTVVPPMLEPRSRRSPSAT